MNIHFTDKTLFESLKRASLANVIVGSHMYGTNNERSDVDRLYIYATSDREINSFLNSHHQLQFKENNVDHNFVSLHTFLRNCLSGDSTINFEVIHSDGLKSTILKSIHDMRSSFITYTIIRSYLGFARRDLKFLRKTSDRNLKTKRLGHIVRGALYAEKMMIGDFDFKKVNEEFRTIDINVDNENLGVLTEIKINKLRNELNDKLNKRTLNLAKTMDVDSLNLLENNLRLIMSSDEYISKKENLKDFDMSMFLNAYENWVEY